ncbi:MAG: hypothetical protein VW907_03455 [Opitutae bacterium]
MGEYPRLASFTVDTEKFCAMIDEFKNPEENEMTPSENIYRSDYDDADGIVDVDDYEEGYADGFEDGYWDDSMDGDFDSAMRDAGFGTDEDYGYYGEDY